MEKHLETETCMGTNKLLVSKKNDITKKAGLTIFMKGRKSCQIKETKENGEKVRLLKQHKTFFCSVTKKKNCRRNISVAFTNLLLVRTIQKFS